MFERWKQRRARRVALHELARLSPHMLRDIGLVDDSFRDPLADRASRLVLRPRRD
jgi:hypothetical protein